MAIGTRKLGAREMPPNSPDGYCGGPPPTLERAGGAIAAISKPSALVLSSEFSGLEMASELAASDAFVFVWPRAWAGAELVGLLAPPFRFVPRPPPARAASRPK